MTILDEIQTSIRHHAEGGGSSVAGTVLAEGRVLINAHSVLGADERTVQVVFTPEIEGK